MSFVLQDGQQAQLTFLDTPTGSANGTSRTKFTFYSLQPATGFPVDVTGDAFPATIFNNSGAGVDIAINAFQNVPPPWQPGGWQQYPRTTFTVVTPGSLYEFFVLDVRNNAKIFKVTIAVT